MMRRKEVLSIENSLKTGEPDKKEVVRTIVENIPEDILKQTTLRRTYSSKQRYGGNIATEDEKKCRLKKKLKISDWIKSPGSGCYKRLKVTRKICRTNQKIGMDIQWKVMVSKTASARY